MSAPASDPTWTTRRRYFPAVEGMRAVAALMVLGGHLLLLSYQGNEDLHTLGRWSGHTGVVVFFLISGFLLYRPFVAARSKGPSGQPDVRSFWLRRVVRILPAYWLALTVLAIWPGFNSNFSEAWWADYALLQVYNQEWVSSGLPQAWSLCVEAAFYLVLPLLALALHRWGLGGAGNGRQGLRLELGLLAGLAALSLLWRGAMASDPSTTYLEHNLLGTFAWFFLGMLLAVMQESDGRQPVLPRLRGVLSRPALCWPVSAAAFAVLVLEPHSSLGLSASATVILEALAAGLFAFGLMGPAVFHEEGRAIRALLANRVIVFLGLISYGIYLWHFSIAGWLNTTDIVLGSAIPFVTLAATTLAASVALGTLSWYAVERPLMRRVRSAKAYTHPDQMTVETPARAEATPAVAAEHS